MVNLQQFLDEEGRVVRWPSRKGDRLVGQQLVVEYLITKFEFGRTYSEREVNDQLNRWHTFMDWALLRREMFNRNLFNRTLDGRQYWVVTPQPAQVE